MQLEFGPEIADADQSIVLESALWKNWLAKAERDFVLEKVHFSSADIISRNGNKQPLFLKLKSTAFDKEGKPQHGIVVLRGRAVAVLVVLKCEGQMYLLLVDQPRFALAERHFLEIPAGILDWSADPAQIALAELAEEAQITATQDELILLGKDIAASCGLLDELIDLYAIEREVSKDELLRYDGLEQTYDKEGEWIKTRILPYAEAHTKLTDGKSLIAMYLYEKLPCRKK
jgi:ADP-sugar diphosphatase